MQELLSNPAIQAAAAPFIVALLLAVIISRFRSVGLGFAILGGFLVAVALTRGLSFQPLTSTPKIILCSLGLPLLMFVVQYLPARTRVTRLSGVIAASGLIAAMLWIIWSVLMRKEGMDIVQMAVPLVLFGTACMMAIPVLEKQSFSARASGVLLLAAGTGATTMIAATALYSQLAFAVAASVGAITLFLLLVRGNGQGRFNAFVLYAAAIPVALLAALSTVYATMPLLVLLFLAAVLVFACVYDRLPIKRPKNAWGDLIVSSLWVSIPLIPAIWLALESAGPVSY